MILTPYKDPTSPRARASACANAKRYYQKHKEERLAYAKRYRADHKEERKEYAKRYDKQYYQTYKEQKKQARLEYHKQHRKQDCAKMKEYQRNHSELIHEMQTRKNIRYRAQMREKLGDTCVVCGNTGHKYTNSSRLHYHELRLRNHTKQSFIYALHSDKYSFVPLCHYCHRMVHELISFNKMSEEQQKKILELVGYAVPNKQTKTQQADQ